MLRLALVLAFATLAGCADEANASHEASWVSEWERKGSLAGLVAVMQGQGWTVDAANSSPEAPVLRLDAANATLRADLAEGQMLVGNGTRDMFRLDVRAAGSRVDCSHDAEPLLRPHLEPTIAALQAEYGPPLGSAFSATDSAFRCRPT